jgi:hypothetical protein
VSGNFQLFSGRRDHVPFSYGVTDLPSGIDQIYSEHWVLGPSIVAVVLTFVLVPDEATRIDVAVREDVESRLDRHGTSFSTKTVAAVKREGIRSVQGEVTRRCLEWLKNKMPGTLSVATEGIRPLTCALVTLAVGKPFDTSADYMMLLGLRQQSLVMKFPGHDFLFLVHPLDGSVQVAAFNESDARQSGWLHDPEYAPELFHERIASLMIADGLIAALHSFERRLRIIRADLNQLDIDESAGTRVIRLRNQLLGLSREISTVCGDVTIFLDNAFMVWADFAPLIPVRPDDGSAASLEIKAERKRQQLRAVVQSLQAQEAELRELILVTTSALNETRTLNLTKTLNRLTWVLVFLTVAVVIAAIVQLVRAPEGTPAPSPSAPASSRTGSPAPRPSARSTGASSRAVSPGVG